MNQNGKTPARDFALRLGEATRPHPEPQKLTPAPRRFLCGKLSTVADAVIVSARGRYARGAVNGPPSTYGGQVGRTLGWIPVRTRRRSEDAHAAALVVGGRDRSLSGGAALSIADSPVPAPLRGALPVLLKGERT